MNKLNEFLITLNETEIQDVKNNFLPDTLKYTDPIYNIARMIYDDTLKELFIRSIKIIVNKSTYENEYEYDYTMNRIDYHIELRTINKKIHMMYQPTQY